MVDKFMLEDAKVGPAAFLVANDNWMEFSLHYVVSCTKWRETKDLLLTRGLDEVESSSERIAMASATLQLLVFPCSR